MSIIHDQERAAYKKILDYFENEKRYVVLLAPMQSGKSNTFKMVGAEMLRHNWADRVVIFSGNREKSLFKQTKSHDEFKEAYADFIGSYIRGKSEIKAAVDAVDSFEVVWGPELKRFDPRTASKGENRILYIWEESHYGQSRRQQVDHFLTRVGIQASGEVMPKGCFLLSVSATPFSELSDLYHFNQNKQVVRLIPGSDYISISKMRSNGQIRRVENIQEGMTRILGMLHVRKFVLIRATKPQQEVLKRMIPSSIRVLHHDQSTVVDDSEELEMDPLNSLLANEPDTPTIIFIKGMCRMGKRVDKSNVVAVMETNCDKTKTDTLAQGLLGRMCGYGPYTHIHVYLVKFNEAELDKLSKLHDGDVEAIPNKGANMMKKTAKSATFCPSKLCGFEDTDGSDADWIQRTKDALDGDVEFTHHFTPEEMGILLRIRELLEDPTKVKRHTNGNALMCEGAVGLTRLRELFASGEVAEGLGSGIGIAANQDELVLYEDSYRNMCYVLVNVKKDETKKAVPKTNGHEVFKTIPAPKTTKTPKTTTAAASADIPDASFARVGEIMYEQSFDEGRLATTTRDCSNELEQALEACGSLLAKNPEKYKGKIKLKSNCPEGMLVGPSVHLALMSGKKRGAAKGVMAQRLAKKGIEIHAPFKENGKAYVVLTEITVTVKVTLLQVDQ